MDKRNVDFLAKALDLSARHRHTVTLPITPEDEEA